MTFLQLYDDQLDIELASSDMTQLFTTARRKAAVNQAQDDFARMTGCTKSYSQPLLQDNQGEYDLEAILTDFVRLDGAPSIVITHGSTVRYIQGPEAFPRSDPEELDRTDPNWRAASPGTPMTWYLREDRGQLMLGTYPAPNITGSDVWSWIIPFIADPPDMVNTTDEPFTLSSNVTIRLRQYHQGLVHKAAALLEPLRKNYSGAERQNKLYAAYVAQYLQQRTEDGRDQVTLIRDYYADSRRAQRALDPRRYP